MGAAVDKSATEPFFFQKPSDAVTTLKEIPYPTRTNDFQYEVELVAVIGKGGSSIKKEAVTDHLFGFALGIDLTRRDIQKVAKTTGRPWDLGKGFDLSAPCTEIIPLPPNATHYTEVLPLDSRIYLKVNGEIKQDDKLKSMIWPVEDLVAILSTYVELQPGDLIYAGTPAGVGPIKPGDVVEANIEGLGVEPLQIKIL
jgi:fumarylpyruvate hydrolase